MSLQSIAKAINSGLVSPNVSDCNNEPANAVDMLHRLSVAAETQADASRLIAEAIQRHGDELHRLAQAVEGLRPVRNPATVSLPN
jgi:hypothetical protein